MIPKTALLPLFSAVLLMGCATRSEIAAAPSCPIVPAYLLECPAAPAVPGAEVTQRDVAAYILDLWAAGAGCRNNLRAVSRIVKSE